MTVTGTHAATERMDSHEVVRQLNSHLGPTLVASLAGTPGRKLPDPLGQIRRPDTGDLSARGG